jgi:hypothetical protein
MALSWFAWRFSEIAMLHILGSGVVQGEGFADMPMNALRPDVDF